MFPSGPPVNHRLFRCLAHPFQLSSTMEQRVSPQSLIGKASGLTFASSVCVADAQTMSVSTPSETSCLFRERPRMARRDVSDGSRQCSGMKQETVMNCKACSDRAVRGYVSLTSTFERARPFQTFSFRSTLPSEVSKSYCLKRGALFSLTPMLRTRVTPVGMEDCPPIVWDSHI